MSKWPLAVGGSGESVFPCATWCARYEMVRWPWPLRTEYFERIDAEVQVSWKLEKPDQIKIRSTGSAGVSMLWIAEWT